MNDVDSVLFGHIKEWSLPVNIFIIQRKPMVEQQIQTLLLSLSTDVKQDSLLIIIFEMGVGSVV